MSEAKVTAPAERQVQLAGMRFGISPTTGREGLRLLRRLSKSFLPAIGSGLVAMNSGKDARERAERLGQVLERLPVTVFAELTEEELDAIVDRLLANVVHIDATRQEVLPLVDLLFRGKTEALLRLLWASAAVSYADFFGGSLGAWARAVGAKMREELAGPVTAETETTTQGSDSKTSPTT